MASREMNSSEEIITNPVVGDIAVEGWRSSDMRFTIAALRLDDPDTFRDLDWSSIASSMGVDRLRINRWSSAGLWTTVFLWTAEDGLVLPGR